jgi:hypothetical protein
LKNKIKKIYQNKKTLESTNQTRAPGHKTKITS